MPDHPPDVEIKRHSIDPKEILQGWSADKILTLLDRPLFDEANYGTVKFHHRYAREYLSARYLNRFLKVGKSRSSIESLIFCKSYGLEVIVPSMRAVAAWLAAWDESVRKKILTIDLDLFLQEGDAAAYSLDFRKLFLCKYAEKYSKGNHEKSSFSLINIRRFAHHDLAESINSILKKHYKTEEISELLIFLIWQGDIANSIQAAIQYAINHGNNDWLRIAAIRAVACAGSPGQKQTTIEKLMNAIEGLDLSIICEVISVFFPLFMSVSQFIEVLNAAEVKEEDAWRIYDSLESLENNTLVQDSHFKIQGKRLKRARKRHTSCRKDKNEQRRFRRALEEIFLWADNKNHVWLNELR